MIDQSAGAAMRRTAPPTTGLTVPFDLSGKRTRHTSERIIGAVLFICGALSIMTTVGIVAVLIQETIRFFRVVSFFDFITGTKWSALFNPPSFGVLPLVSATLQISLIAMLIALPLGLMSAIYLSEYAAPRVRVVLKPALELLAGIPTIVYGFFALTFITPEVLKKHRGLQRAGRGHRGWRHGAADGRDAVGRCDDFSAESIARGRLCAWRNQARSFNSSRRAGRTFWSHRLIYPCAFASGG
jgi:hypothetical protein